jgi:hypothetical protein
MRCFLGKQELKKYANHSVVCSGSTMGSVPALKKYTERMVGRVILIPLRVVLVEFGGPALRDNRAHNEQDEDTHLAVPSSRFRIFLHCFLSVWLGSVCSRFVT